MTREQVMERLWDRVEEQPNGCWVWTKTKDRKGYGKVGNGKQTWLVHRLAYEYVVGKIPDGLTLDHLCRNRACCNPAHLEPVSNRENILRGNGAPARNARKTHCPKGHPYAGENLFIRATGYRACRECRREASRRTYWKRRGIPARFTTGSAVSSSEKGG